MKYIRYDGYNELTPPENPWEGCLVWVVVALVIALALLTSCRTHRQLTSDSRDSVRVETVVRYESVLDTVFVEIPNERERQTVRDTISHLETSFALSDARINKDGTLYHSLENKPQKRPIEIQKEVVYRDSIVYRDRVVTKTEVKEVPRDLTWWQKAQMRGFWVLLFIIVIACRKRIL